MIDSRFSRRRLLRSLGAGGALVPLLDASPSYAAAPLYPKRFIVAIWTNGTVQDQFWPQGSGGDLKALTLPAITKPLEDFKSDLIFVQGVELKNFRDYPGHGAGHENFATTFLGAKGKEIAGPAGPRFVGGGPSVDQYIAGELEKVVKLPFRSLCLGARIGGGFEGNHQSRCFWRGADQAVSPEQDAARGFSTVFGAGVQGGNASEVFEKIRLERKSMLDYLGPSVESFARRVGGEDRQKIQAHLTSVRELEKQLGAMSAGAKCESPKVAGGDYPATMNAHMDVVVSAMKCDLTRVAALQFSNGNGSDLEFSWIGLSGAGQEYARRTWHDVAHRPGSGSADKVKLDAWIMAQLASLCRKLKSVPEAGGTMLDNTVILWANHMGNGGAHNSVQLPWVVAGRGGGYLKTGQMLRPTSVPTNGVMKACIGAMGVDASRFGDPAYGGELAEMRG